MEEKRPFISVVVAFRNEAENLQSCVQSLLSQDYPAGLFELIFVDDGSTDDGESALKGYGGRIALIKSKATNSYAARNRGIENSRGDVVAFMDADSIADKSWLQNLADAFGASGAEAVGGELFAYKPNTHVESFEAGLLSQKMSLSNTHPYSACGNFAIRRRLLAEVGQFDEQIPYGGDVDMSWRIIGGGRRISYAPGAIIYHRNVTSSWALFRKMFLKATYLPAIIKKNFTYLKSTGMLQRVDRNHYKEIASNALLLLLPAGGRDREGIRLKTVMLLGRKLGLIYGSIKHGFLFI